MGGAFVALSIESNTGPGLSQKREQQRRQRESNKGAKERATKAQ